MIELPFALRFAFSILYYTEVEEQQKKKRGEPGNTYHVNDVRWTQGGYRVPDYLRASFLPVKRMILCECLGALPSDRALDDEV